MSVTAGSLRRPLSRDILCKSTVTSPTSVTAARPPFATRGTLPATKPSTQVQCWLWGQLWGGCGLVSMWVLIHQVCAWSSFLCSVSRAVPDGKSKVLCLALPRSPWTEHQTWEWGRYLPLQQGWNSTSFAVKHWAALFLKVSCKIPNWEQMCGLQVTLW